MVIWGVARLAQQLCCKKQIFQYRDFCQFFKERYTFYAAIKRFFQRFLSISLETIMIQTPKGQIISKQFLVFSDSFFLA